MEREPLLASPPADVEISQVVQDFSAAKGLAERNGSYSYYDDAGVQGLQEDSLDVTSSLLPRGSSHAGHSSGIRYIGINVIHVAEILSKFLSFTSIYMYCECVPAVNVTKHHCCLHLPKSFILEKFQRARNMSD